MGQTNQPNTPANPNDAGYIVLNGKRLELEEHPTDFSVMGTAPELSHAVAVAPLSANIRRATAASPQDRDELMEEVRKETVAHHIYKVQDTDEEIVIDDRIFLTLRNDNPEDLEAILQEYSLEPAGRMGKAYVLRVTEATGRNPLRTANAIAQRPEVLSCTPELLIPMVPHQTINPQAKRLFSRQWYLNAGQNPSPDVTPTADIDAPEAWQMTMGDPAIVIAVIDDGFDLKHPAFLKKRIHPARRDFGVFPTDRNPGSEGDDYHGTCVASIATASAAAIGMMSVAPNCTFLPIRIGFGPMAPQVDILEIFRYASQYADVVNCSFGTPPTSYDPFYPEFRSAMTELAQTGGRRGKGLVMVFSAGNDDAPTFLRGADNRNGVRFVRFTGAGAQIAVIPAGRDVYSGYPMTEGIIVVGAMSSRTRKSGYSSWGQHITVCAPSNNGHYIMDFIRPGQNDAIRSQFVANYRGLGQIAAVNRPGRGDAFDPMFDNPATSFRENYFTATFGGTSGAAPVVTGTVALMLSANPNLTAAEVRQILMATADQNLDTTLDLANDPNTQGISGAFANGRSAFFGAGKVNAFHAVRRAQALLGPSAPIPTVSMSVEETAPAMPMATSALQDIHVQTLAWADQGMANDSIGRWRLGAPHMQDAPLEDIRVWALGANGEMLEEILCDSMATGDGLPRPDTFRVHIGSYPPQVGHPPYFTELMVNRPNREARGEVALLVVSAAKTGLPVEPRAVAFAMERSPHREQASA